MPKQNEEKIAASACLAGIPCRYDGQSKPCAKIVELYRAGRIVPICPETLGGLKAPREPSEQRQGRVYSKSGLDVTEQFKKGAEAALKKALSSGAKKIIVKSRSPACGLGEIYDGSFTGKLTKGCGIWTEKLLESGFEVYAEEQIPEDL